MQIWTHRLIAMAGGACLAMVLAEPAQANPPITPGNPIFSGLIQLSDTFGGNLTTDVMSATSIAPISLYAPDPNAAVGTPAYLMAGREFQALAMSDYSLPPYTTLPFASAFANMALGTVDDSAYVSSSLSYQFGVKCVPCAVGQMVLLDITATVGVETSAPAGGPGAALLRALVAYNEDGLPGTSVTLDSIVLSTASGTDLVSSAGSSHLNLLNNPGWLPNANITDDLTTIAIPVNTLFDLNLSADVTFGGGGYYATAGADPSIVLHPGQDGLANFELVFSEVPEPASLVLFGSAVAGFGLSRRRRQAILHGFETLG